MKIFAQSVIRNSASLPLFSKSFGSEAKFLLWIPLLIDLKIYMQNKLLSFSLIRKEMFYHLRDNQYIYGDTLECSYCVICQVVQVKLLFL